MVQQTLNGTWTMFPQLQNDSICMEQFAWKDAYLVQIPGSVLSALCDTGAIGEKYADPYYRDNEFYLRELFWQDYWFEREFSVESNLLDEDCVELVCMGLDTLAEIYINDRFVAKADNMHRTWRFDVKAFLTEGTNHIQIRFLSTLRYIQEYKAEENKEIHYGASGAIRGNQYIRKAHSMFGWDWGAQLPDAGIFREIRLEAYSTARLADVRYKQTHAHGKVRLQVCSKVQFSASCSRKRDDIWVKVSVRSPEGVCMAEQRGEDSTFVIDNPKLWWVNGLGAQPLYTVETTLVVDGRDVEKRTDKIGLRTFTVSREKDEWGEEFAFTINGVRFFAMGANYIPEDCIYSRITRERQEYLIKSAVRANYNCIRVWGGGYYPSDDFYDLCDQYGLIVWQDLMYACNTYDLTSAFEENIVAETIDNVRRLRHHACLGLWCGNNEIESAWHHWQDFMDQSPYLRADYIKQFEYVLPNALRKEDDTTFYWPSSPSSGGCFDNPDDENRGDTHYWNVWHGQRPFSDYQNHYFRFCSEFGFQSFPSCKTVYTYTREEDRNIFSQVMECHQKNDAANGKMLYYISENFRYPKDFESLLYVTQVLQGVAVKSGVEHWRRNRGRCMGAIYWQLNDNWSVASWSSIDYYGRWKALHYMAQDFFRPVSGSLVCIPDNDSSTPNGGEHFTGAAAYVANESAQEEKVNVTVSLKTFDFATIVSQTTALEVPAFASRMALEMDFSQYVQRQPRILVSPEKKRAGELYDKKEVFVEAVFVYGDGRVQKESVVLLPYKYMDLPQCHITHTVGETAEGYEIMLESDMYAAFVELDFADADVIFSENCFDLTDHEVKKITLRREDILSGDFADSGDVSRRLRIRSIRDSY
ncbi:MAG: glycoside hydrolase family 2 protein [Lachnospiraceae bacterium]|nr:glycoside hydrolase family 2 protein [Lachnospiraceae bacterium]